jgi:hypothetical protein
MFKQSFFILMGGMLIVAFLAGLVAAFLASRDATVDDSPDVVVKLTADEVAALLGIKEKDSVKIEGLESGRDGVKVNSISLRDNDSTEVEIQDIDLRIMSTDRHNYAISYLRIGKLNIFDWKTTQRVQVFGVVVDRPGDDFLSKLEATIASLRSGGSLKKADLSCMRLGIDKIDYRIRAKDAVVTKVSIEELSITEATSETLGEFRVGRVGMDDTTNTGRLGCKNQRLTKVNRFWADRILALLLTLPGTDPATTLKLDAARFKAPALGKNLFPFDRFEVPEMSFIFQKAADLGSGIVKVTDLCFDVQRTSEGKLTRIHGKVNVIVPTQIFGKMAGGEKEVSDFFRAMGNPDLEESLACSVQLNIVPDHDRNEEQFEISISAPGLAAISATAITRRLPEFLSMLITELKLYDGVTMSSLKIEARDDGLFVFLVSERFKRQKDVHKFFKDIPNNFPVSERVRLSSDIDKFLASPGSIILDGKSGDFMNFDKIFGNSRLSFVSK